MGRCNTCNDFTEYGTHCEKHCDKLFGIRVGKSILAGLGLFATRKHPAGSLICNYDGEKLNRDEYLRRYPGKTDGIYVFEVHKNLYLDGADPNSCFGRYANHLPWQSPKYETSNCKFEIVKDGNLRAAYIVARRDIEVGEEITVCYGDGYFFEGDKLSLPLKKKI